MAVPPPAFAGAIDAGTLIDGRLQQEVSSRNAQDGERFTVWESAGLVNLFSAIEEKAPCTVWIHFRGFGTAKRGQNPPKLFDSAIG